MSCSATAMSSSSNLCSGFSTAFPARVPPLVATLAARAIVTLSFPCPRWREPAPWPLPRAAPPFPSPSLEARSEEHTSELQSHLNLVCRLLLEKKKSEKPPVRPPLVQGP